MLISLDKMSGLVQTDNDNYTATVRAGTKLNQLGALLFEKGLALENMGDIDVQSLGGALSTGTHGTGLQFGTLSTQVIKIRMVTPAGKITECSEKENPELFKAAQVSLGALGVMTEYTLQCRPAYKLQYVAKKETLPYVLDAVEEYNDANRNFEFYWFPYTNTVQTKCSNETDYEIAIPSKWKSRADDFLENEAFGALCNMARRVPSFAFSLNKIAAVAISNVEKTDWSYKVYATQRRVRFMEMEYNIPYEAFGDVKKELVKMVNGKKFRVAFPVENRFVKEDDIFISPACGRKSAYIAVHQSKGMEYEPYFRAVEEIMIAHDGRPHWGKMHFQRADYFEKMYPYWDRFLATRKQCDPDAVLVNDYLKELFGV
jgi:FAD-linked oxidoreductase